MIKLIDILKEEIFKAYHGRYIFDVDKAYDLIKSNNIKFKIYKLNPSKIHLTSPTLTNVDPEKIKNIKIDYSKPIGLVVAFKNPETDLNELLLIDGNHRTTKAMEEGKEALYYIIDNPKEVKKIMKFNKKIPHKLFLDDDDE
jgi:hypothetical protein